MAAKKQDRRLELMPLSKLERAKRNPKHHRPVRRPTATNEGQGQGRALPRDLKAIDESFDRFGYVEPIVRDERTGRLVAGHGRTDQLAEAFKKAPDKPPAGVEAVLKDGKVAEWLVPVLRGWGSKNDAQAEAYLVASNRITEAGGWDDRALTELLKELNESDSLAGTGFDAQQLAALAFVTRTASEVGDLNEAAEWLGMPEFETVPDSPKLIVIFDTEKKRDELVKQLRIHTFGRKQGKTWSCWWPPRGKEDPGSLRFKSKKG